MPMSNDEFAAVPGKMPEKLQEYWTKGEGGGKVAWGTDGSMKRCMRLLKAEGVPQRMVGGACARLHKRATGQWPTEGGEAGIPS